LCSPPPRLEFPPSDAPKLNFHEIVSVVDTNYTDIAAAIKLALAHFRGNGQANCTYQRRQREPGRRSGTGRIAKLNGVQIDVVPIIYRNENEVMVQSVEAPALTEQERSTAHSGAAAQLSFATGRGELTLRRSARDREWKVPGSPRRVVLHPA